MTDLTLAENIERHNAASRALAQSYEKSAAHASFMAARADYANDRRKYERQVKRYKRAAKEAWATILPEPPIDRYLDPAFHPRHT